MMTKSSQAELFDREAAIAARDEAIDRVETTADDRWKFRAYDALVRVARASGEFIVDEVWKELGDDRPVEARAMGAVLRAGRVRKIIAPTDRYLPSDQPQCHRNPRRVWRSLVYVLALVALGCTSPGPFAPCELRNPIELRVVETSLITVDNPQGCMVIVKLDDEGNVLERIESPDLVRGMCEICK